ncbi:MAG: hypothetical protein HN919_08305 [Verrucomicrobia bacterium]|jgi:hypothetical protein|nr:hypothetical protein [Verrucomicrobiota bacterium]MBT7066287.1 hypothetical protein [Verrucomicrobiota bacterium]MBT7699653.1 hypothetical protein [Verrucomicrobiota bacterium]
MTTLDQTVEAIGAVAAQLTHLHAEAARLYGSEVDCIVTSGSRDVRHIERALDGLLGFASDETCLELFRRLCRHYWDIDPTATAEYIHAYRELWDSDNCAEQDTQA